MRAACCSGNQRLLPLPEAFAKETEGVRAAEDIEDIHRMRGASPRLRAVQVTYVNDEEEIAGYVIVSPGISREKECTRTKSDLFTRAYGRNRVIR